VDAAVLRGALLLGSMAFVGWAAAPSRRRPDLFAVVLTGVAVTSVAGVALARLGTFSLPHLALVVAAVGAALALVRRRWRLDGAPPASRAVRATALVAGLVAAGAAWPPFETFLAAADSTMYLDAGVHLARTGTLAVPDTVARALPSGLARSLFPSVGMYGQGPFIRLPGGLLMRSLDAGEATPAFFPLLPVWTGIAVAVGGAAAAPLVAPVGVGLAVAAVTLFAGETFGLAAAVPTALLLVTNFVVWWFGRFPMSETLTIALVWGGLVFAGRGAPFAAGVLLGLGGLARAETLVFALAACVAWAVWTRVEPREVASLMVGLGLGALAAVVGLLTAPSHHFAYLANDLALAKTRLLLRAQPAFADGRMATALVLLPVLPVLAAVVASWRGGRISRNLLRGVVALALIAGVALYFRIGGREEPLRHLGWLAAYLSPVGFALAVGGLVVAWSRAGTAGRLALVLALVVAAIFIPNPRVGAYQPWAMRRFLPVVLPALALTAGVALGALFAARRRWVAAAGGALLVVALGLAVRPIAAVWSHPYYAGTLEGVRRVAEQVPENGIVVLDLSFSDLQLQVPLWLVYGRENVMVTGGRPLWRALLEALVDGDRPIYWLQSRLAAPPESAGFRFDPVAADLDFVVELPDAPRDAPPTERVRKLVPLRLYRVGVGVA
jgi:hypothetical protein